MKSHIQALFCIALKSPFKMAVGFGVVGVGERIVLRWQPGKMNSLKSPVQASGGVHPDLSSGCTQYLALIFPLNILFTLALSWYEEKTNCSQRQLIQTQALIPQRETANTVSLHPKTHL